MSGAPAYVDRLISGLEDGLASPASLRQLGVGGARVPVGLCRRTLAALPGVEAKVLYGSTEAEPIASAGFEEVVAQEEQGVLVGREAAAAEVELVDLPDPPPVLDERDIAPYRVTHGELIVRGEHVNRRYLDNPEADRANKLQAPDGTVWHRTGDVARRDSQGRIWLTGRLPDLVRWRGRTLHPFLLEALTDRLDGVERSALLAVGEEACLVVELQHAANKELVEQSLMEVLASNALSDLCLEFVDRIPTDRRHNSKIDRPALRRTVGSARG